MGNVGWGPLLKRWSEEWLADGADTAVDQTAGAGGVLREGDDHAQVTSACSCSQSAMRLGTSAVAERP
ncbi:hypothetical protein [Streptomyces sp. NRRL WC-3744]|uniref:hypothetical protein n=1 Tax=Streptomyces sp. NRRL WC-3744 TaxID=1463935 RepID=UPI000AE3E280|nr:hypothetical protein [Streptomyces sp. NRRL WC-3744]